MTAKQLAFWNRIVATEVFIIALLTFGLTVEPTASFWDAGEYIATSAKLQVGHPPGAPFFQMMGAFFALFATGPEKIALMVNLMSVFSSAFTVLFLYLSLTLLLRKLPSFKEVTDKREAIGYFGSAAVGALAFCFSDSFWFNAVEAEVYAMATCILSALFWMALRWEREMNTPRGDRWLLLIAFVIGLSFGVHFMGLLTIPAIGMLYFFKNTKKVTFKNFITANIVSVAILLFIFKMLLPSTLALFSKMEVFFVNQVNLPFNSGTIITGILFLVFFYYSLRFTSAKNYINLNTGILCVLFVLLGFSSWIMLPIRANTNTVINENSPSDARQLLAYYNLEQYPETKLFYGPMFSDMYAGQDDFEPYIDDKPKYERNEKTGRYVIVNHWENARINANSNHKGFLPRLWSSEHAENYINFTGPLEFSIRKEYRGSEELFQRVAQFRQDAAEGILTGEDYHQFYKTMARYIDIEKPTFFANIYYFFTYQVDYMYLRYFLWNFAGRQDDIQGKYDILHGNWLSGIPFIDEIRLGNQSAISEDAKNNKARNTYFFLPFILGLMGLLFLYQQDKKRFWVLLLFFLFTGLALKVYLNERPFEPRERDYALVGSFYVFAIWIGMGAFYLSNELRRVWNNAWARPIAAAVCLLAVPFLMAYQNWDDHDRSGRYTAQSVAKSYLTSIQEDKGAMIFTIGDNDTFALWYAQDIEGYRTDVRPINTSLLATDWYIDQMKRKTYESEPIPSQLTHDKYVYGIRDYIKYEPLADSLRWNIKDFVNWVESDDPRTKYKSLIAQSGGDPALYPMGTQEMIFYPTNKIRVPVNIENVIKSGLVNEKDRDQIVPYIDIDLPKGGLYKNQLMMLDILANNDWERPIYFTGGSYAESEYLWMKEYLQLEGLVYKLVPIKTPLNPVNPYIMGRLDADLMYEIVKQWEWGNSNSPDIYHDPETRKNSISYRSNMVRLAEVLIDEGKDQKAEEIMDLALEKMPIEYFGYYSLLTPFVDAYYRIEKKEKARKVFEAVAKKHHSQLDYFNSLSLNLRYELGEEILTEVERYRALVEAVLDNKDNEKVGIYIQNFRSYSRAFAFLYGEYDYYTAMEEFVEGLYLAGEIEEARALVNKISEVYDERLEVIQGFEPERQLQLRNRIMDEVNGFRRILLYVNLYDNEAQRDSLENKIYNRIKDLVIFDDMVEEN